MRALTLMFAFAAVALAGRARAEDDPACAQYQEPFAYNACLARHGPKAADVATSPGSTPGHAPQAEGETRSRSQGRRTAQITRATPSVGAGAPTWSFG